MTAEELEAAIERNYEEQSQAKGRLLDLKNVGRELEMSLFKLDAQFKRGDIVSDGFNNLVVLGFMYSWRPTYSVAKIKANGEPHARSTDSDLSKAGGKWSKVGEMALPEVTA